MYCLRVAVSSIVTLKCGVVSTGPFWYSFMARVVVLEWQCCVVDVVLRCGTLVVMCCYVSVPVLCGNGGGIRWSTIIVMCCLLE